MENTYFITLKQKKAIVLVGYGIVINSASITGLRGSKEFAPYSASKHAVISLSKSAALEVVDAGFLVNAICLGYVDTRMMLAIEEGKASGQAQQLRAKTMENVPMKRYEKPEEIANLILFLASDASSYITGSQYVIDGGLLA
ncbi:SDR family NAD(P)-dependent oxidoreductase [Lysinibacillus xylanilyticus]